jgi:hypothetical protein
MCSPRSTCPGGCGKAIEAVWWTCDPATGDDLFAACGYCHGEQPPQGFSPDDHRAYQRANRCPSIPREEWDESAPQIEAGPDGENALDGCHHCPGAYAREPAAQEAARARRWWDKGQLALIYPEGVTEAVADAVDLADQTANRWRVEGERLREAARVAEAAKRRD